MCSHFLCTMLKDFYREKKMLRGVLVKMDLKPLQCLTWEILVVEEPSCLHSFACDVRTHAISTALRKVFQRLNDGHTHSHVAALSQAG